MLSVLSWFAARKSRRPAVELVMQELRAEPTLFAILADRYTNESSLRPFAPLAERLADRMHVFVLAEWPQDERQQDGEAILTRLGVSREAWPMLLRDEEGDTRYAIVLRRKQPVALINLFFRERRQGGGEREDDELRAWEDQAFGKLDGLLSRLSPIPPEAARPLAPDQHDFLTTGICRKCGQGKGTLLACGVQRPLEPGPSRDRFELIELD
ncbi:MAG TPA: hypothetical protein VG496_11450 [Myxococcales bacterium]|nr:hypothetical protein [Myxococcales bacterium]